MLNDSGDRKRDRRKQKKKTNRQTYFLGKCSKRLH